MWRLAWRSIRAHLLRFLLTAFAVFLGVSFLTATLSLRTMAEGTYQAAATATSNADIYVLGEVVGDKNAAVVARKNLPVTLQEQIGAVAGVDTVYPFYQAMGLLIGKDGSPSQVGMAPTIVSGYFPGPPLPEIVDGRPPQGPDEIVVDQHTLENAQLKLGDRTTVVLGGKPVEVNIVGVASYGAAIGGLQYFLVDPQVYKPLLSPQDTCSRFGVMVSDGAKVADVVKDIQAKLGSEVSVITKAQERADSIKTVETAIGFIKTFLLIFAAVALFIGSFIIANTFALTVRGQVKEFALLRAIGASGQQIFTSVLAQAVLVGLVGSAAGVAGGYGLINLLRWGLRQMKVDLAENNPLAVSTVVTALVLGTLVTVISALVPARRAATTAPVEALRQAQGANERSLTLRTAVGLVATAGGVGACLAAAFAWVDYRGTALGVGTVAIVFGLLALNPALVKWVLRPVLWPVQKLWRPAGLLAVRNLGQNARRTAATAAALLIGTALVAAAAVVAASVQESTKNAVAGSFLTDYVITGQAMSGIPDEVVTKVVAIPGVATVTDQIFTGMVEVTTPSGEQTVSRAQSLPEQSLETEFHLPVTAGNIRQAMANGQLTVQIDFAQQWGLSVGDTVHVKGQATEADYTIGAIADSAMIGGDIVVSPQVRTSLGFANDHRTWVLVTLGSSATAATVQDSIKELLKPYYLFTVQTPAELSDKMAGYVDNILAVIYALLALSIVIAVLGIINTQLLSVSERTREIGLLRAVGYSRTNMSLTIMAEAVITAVFGAVVGTAAGVGVAAVLPQILADSGLKALVIPWGKLGIIQLIAAVAGVLAALWPAWRAGRLPILQAIATE